MTLNDRLMAALVKAGAATAEEIASGKWSPGIDRQTGRPVEGQCPYFITTLPDGARRIEVNKGDVLVRASGATLADAIAALEQKVGIEA